MPWVKTDDQMVDHPKYEAVSPEAFKWAHRGLSYANRFLTDGHLPIAFTSKVPDAIMDELTTIVPGQRNPVWHRNADRSVEIHDFLIYQPSRKAVEKERRKAKRRQAKWRKTKGKPAKKRNAVTNALVTVPPTRSRPGTQYPPTPRVAGGLRILRSDQMHAEKILRSWAGWCRHEPACPDATQCRRRLAREHAELRARVAS